ncbi:biopolymer transporter ExbD [Roseivivax marinus]|uniref:ExbD/TolR family protein n=1 Tax=Roseivivax marinus TaxID=1379903 RepID=UPI001F03907F|nr:biopolymer transporter ExbD [Roseivivax marinus]UMA66204.1 biopolymer transporter ExbD [Roseivivax marinus]
MRIDAPQRRRPQENLVPMINVVFLLLIFFLMTAQIAPPEPFEVEPPEVSEAADADGTLSLYLGPDGQIGFRDATGDEAIAAIAAAREEDCGGACDADGPVLMLRADRNVAADEVAALMTRLGTAGITRIELVTARQ